MSGPIPIARWGDGVRREAERIVAGVLSGVGFGPTIKQTTSAGIALHARRSLNDEEMAMLSAEWLAIPAQDEFSEDGLVEMRL